MSDIEKQLLSYNGKHPYLLSLKDLVDKGEVLNFSQNMFAKKLLISHAVKTKDRTLLPLPALKSFLIDWNKYIEKPPYSFQKLGINWLMNKDKAILGDEMGCIDGEALISVNRNKGSFKIKLKDLYEKYNGISGKWDRNVSSYATCNIEGQLFMRKILGVFYKGKKKVLKITLEDGKILKATPDHLFLKEGETWAKLETLKVGETILTNGTDVCPNCNTFENLISFKGSKFIGYCKKCMYRVMRSNKYKSLEATEHVLDKGYIYVKGRLRFHPFHTTGRIYKHRLIYEASLNKLTYKEWLNIIKLGKFAENHVFLKPSQIIHHIDKNPLNNNIENLECISISGHSKIHKDRSRIKKTLSKPLKISSIVDEGEEVDVYDMTVEEAHNYVANGIIVHNCGKTFQAIVAAIELNIDRILIICPNTLKLNWMKEIESLGETSISIFKKEFDLNAKWTIINYDKLSKVEVELKKLKFKLLIGDEAHLVKNSSSKRGKAFQRISTKIPKTWLLTGTPIANRPIDFYQLLKLCKHDLGKDKMSFGRKYCNGTLNNFGWDYSGASNLKDLHFRTQDIILRRLKDQVLDLPSKQLIPVYLEMNNIKKYYQAAEDRFQEIYNNIDNPDSEHYGKDLGSGAAFIELAAFRMFCALEKLEDGTLSDLINNSIESGGKVVVFTNFTKVVDAVKKEFEENCVTLDGRVSIEDRQANIQSFQKGIPQVCVCNYKVGSVGTTLTAGTVSIMNDLPWDPATLQQAMDRIHRIGQDKKVTIYFPVYTTTIDEIMFKVLKEKMNNINEAIDGSSNEIKFKYKGSVADEVYRLLKKRK